MYDPPRPQSGVDKYIIPTEHLLHYLVLGEENLPDFRKTKTSVNKRLLLCPSVLHR